MNSPQQNDNFLSPSYGQPTTYLTVVATLVRNVWWHDTKLYMRANYKLTLIILWVAHASFQNVASYVYGRCIKHHHHHQSIPNAKQHTRKTTCLRPSCHWLRPIWRRKQHLYLRREECDDIVWGNILCYLVPTIWCYNAIFCKIWCKWSWEIHNRIGNIDTKSIYRNTEFQI